MSFSENLENKQENIDKSNTSNDKQDNLEDDGVVNSDNNNKKIEGGDPIGNEEIKESKVLSKVPNSIQDSSKVYIEVNYKPDLEKLREIEDEGDKGEEGEENYMKDVMDEIFELTEKINQLPS